VDALFAVGRVEIKAGNPQKGLDRSSNPHIAMIDIKEQQARFCKLPGSYKLMNKPAEALRNYEIRWPLTSYWGRSGVATAASRRCNSHWENQTLP
jgi:hypothetical protein